MRHPRASPPTAAGTWGPRGRTTAPRRWGRAARRSRPSARASSAPRWGGRQYETQSYIFGRVDRLDPRSPGGPAIELDGAAAEMAGRPVWQDVSASIARGEF